MKFVINKYYELVSMDLYYFLSLFFSCYFGILDMWERMCSKKSDY